MSLTKTREELAMDFEPRPYDMILMELAREGLLDVDQALKCDAVQALDEDRLISNRDAVVHSATYDMTIEEIDRKAPHSLELRNSEFSIRFASRKDGDLFTIRSPIMYLVPAVSIFPSVWRFERSGDAHFSEELECVCRKWRMLSLLDSRLRSEVPFRERSTWHSDWVGGFIFDLIEMMTRERLCLV